MFLSFSQLSPAQGQNPRGDDAVVVTASRIEQQLTDVLPHTTVITRKDIQESRVPDLQSLLRREAGFEFTQNGGIGNVSTVVLRGGSASHTLILIDGIRAGSMTLGTTQIEGIMLDQVERVEIVRGNVSALYGSGALGGVIQIFTKRGKGAPSAEAQVMTGARGTNSVAAGYGGSVGDTRFGLNVSQYRTGGFSAINTKQAPNANPDSDGYLNTSFSGQMVHTLATGHEIGLLAYQNYGEVQFDNAFGARTDRHRAENGVSSYSIYTQNQLTNIWNSRITIGEGSDRGKSFTNGATPTRTDTQNSQLQWQNQFRLAPDHVVTAGLEELQQRVQSTTNYPVRGRDVRGATLGYNGRVDAHQFQTNVRNEMYSDFGRAYTWLGGYGHELSPSWKATAMRSSAFNAPTFNQLYFPGFGNPALKPEKSSSNELGLQYAEGGQLLRIAMFRTDYRDLIQTVSGLPRNVASARIEGTEVSYTGQFSTWDIRASLTLQDPINSVTGAQLRRRAATFWNVVAGTDYMGWRLGAELIVSGTRPDLDIVSSAALDLGSYKLVNLTAKYPLTTKSFVAARLENMFNEKYQLAQGYNTPGRGLFLSLGWQQ
jgi:vitamin B12 transporter